jgi:hypothetical protein
MHCGTTEGDDANEEDDHGDDGMQMNDQSSDFAESTADLDTEEAPPTFSVHADAQSFAGPLAAFYEHQLSSSPVEEARTTVGVVQHYLLYALAQPRPPVPLPRTVTATQLDMLILDVPRYSTWLKAGSLQHAKAATRLAYLSRYQRWLKWRLAQVGHLLDPNVAAVRVATTAVLAHVQELRRLEARRTKQDQQERLSKEALIKGGKWATVQDLMRALSHNRAQYDALISQAATRRGMRLGDRSFCTAYLLATLAVKLAPARPGFWQALDLVQFTDAAASDSHILSSTKFKMARVYGFKSVQLTEEVIGLISDYCAHVRPYCLKLQGVQTKVDTGPTAPLFLNPNGGRLSKMSSKVELFFYRVLGVRVHVTRVRQIMHTKASPRSLHVHAWHLQPYFSIPCLLC